MSAQITERLVKDVQFHGAYEGIERSLLISQRFDFISVTGAVYPDLRTDNLVTLVGFGTGKDELFNSAEAATKHIDAGVSIGLFAVQLHPGKIDDHRMGRVEHRYHKLMRAPQQTSTADAVLLTPPRKRSAVRAPLRESQLIVRNTDALCSKLGQLVLQ